MLFIINSISYFKFLSTYFGQSKLKQKNQGSLITIIFFWMIVITWLNYCKLLWWFYYDDTKDVVFVWFHLLIYINCFQLSSALIILEIWWIICLKLNVLIIFLYLLLFHNLLVVALVNSDISQFCFINRSFFISQFFCIF